MTLGVTAFTRSNMPARALSANKIRNIITLHALSHLSHRELSRLFDVSPSTARKYLSAFERSSISFAESRRLTDQDLKRSLLPPRRELPRNGRHEALIELFPLIHQCLKDPSYSQFTNLYGHWLSTNNLARPGSRWAIALSTEDIKVLDEWRSLNNKRRWERAWFPSTSASSDTNSREPGRSSRVPIPSTVRSCERSRQSCRGSAPRKSSSQSTNLALVRLSGAGVSHSFREIRTIPQRQRSKGSLICTAALELSTNRVTHFYSTRKNTAEMIKMLETLVAKYRDQDRIILSWDAASWHASKAFIQKVGAFNTQRSKSTSSRPRVELAPLPSGAQFL